MGWRSLPILLSILGTLALPGCGSDVESAYGRSGDRSVNGTGVFAELLRSRGHTVRTAVRLSDKLADWADVIVRFAPYPGPPERKEGQWYHGWLTRVGERKMIYVPRDYDALAEYWDGVLARIGKEGDPALRKRAETMRDRVPGWSDRLPSRPKEVASPEDWFAVKSSKSAPVVCKTLGGPWGRPLDPVKAALTRHETLEVESESVVLEGDGEPLAIQWTLYNESRVLVVANGSFLLNATLVNRARRPLAMRAAGWVGDEPLHVAFVEGSFVLREDEASPSVFAILKVPPFGWVAAQLLVLGLAACLARAPRLGRPRPDPPSGEDRPVAHPQALGSLLARTGQAADARAILEAYRRWRSPSHHVRVGQPTVPDPVETIPPDPGESPEHE